MKKRIFGLAAGIFAASALSAQVLPSAGVENNLWTGFGSPLHGDVRYYGFIDCLQARVDIAQFTVDAMLNWGAVTSWDGDDLDGLVIENTEQNAFNRHYWPWDNKNDVADVNGYNNQACLQNWQDSYYVNFLWHPFKGFDVGMGTKLNWQVGPAPGYGSWLWEPDAHVRQGGFSTAYDDRHGKAGEYEYSSFDAGNRPGTADVVGFVPYANKYAKTALGVRYVYDKDFFLEAGGAIPSGTDMTSPRVNLGVALAPVKWLRIATAYEGLFHKDGNLYAGVTLGAKKFILDAYFAWDSIDASGGDKDMAWGTGAAITFSFPKVGITIRPEAGINFFEEPDFTPAWYVGGLFSWDFAKRMCLSAWSSFAIGSKDRNWDDYDETDDWNGGHIFDIRPQFTFKLNNRHAFSAYVDLEWRTAFDGHTRNCWSSGVFWTYRYPGSRR